MTKLTTSPTLVKGNWNKQISKFKTNSAILTDADLYYEEDTKVEMLNKLQFKHGKTNGILSMIISAL